MTEQEKILLKVAKERLCAAGYCDDDCKYYRFGAYDCHDCCDMNTKAINIIEDAFAQRDALLADLKFVCAKNNPCLVCGHFRPKREDYEKCELKEWVCEWVWRGEKHG